MIRTALVIVLALSGIAAAQQTTVYGPDGRAVTRSTTDSQGTTTVYDARTGNVAARVSRPPTPKRHNR